MEPAGGSRRALRPRSPEAGGRAHGEDRHWARDRCDRVDHLVPSWRGLLRSRVRRPRRCEPIPAYSGNTVRHRLSRGGDRRLNRAPHIATITGITHDPATRSYVEKRRIEGRTTKEIRRGLKGISPARSTARSTHRRGTHPAWQTWCAAIEARAGSAPWERNVAARALHAYCRQESILYSLASPCESSRVATPSATRSSKPR